MVVSTTTARALASAAAETTKTTTGCAPSVAVPQVALRGLASSLSGGCCPTSPLGLFVSLNFLLSLGTEGRQVVVIMIMRMMVVEGDRWALQGIK